jgi:hypothetical protein
VKFWVSVCVCGSVQVSVWCFGLCFCGFWVRFYVVWRDVLCWLWCALRMLTKGSAVKEISEEEGGCSLIPSSTIVVLCFAGSAVRKKKTGQ